MKGVAVYAGSFDPPTMGHLDVISRVQPLFDKLILVVADNIRKTTLFSSKERADLLSEAVKQALPGKKFEIHVHGGLIVDFCREAGAGVLVRGLRAMSDFEYEFQMAAMNRRLNPSVETLHIMTDERFFYFSSTTIKEIAHHGGDLNELVPPNVAKLLAERTQAGARK